MYWPKGAAVKKCCQSVHTGYSLTLLDLTCSLGAHCTGQLLVVVVWRAADDVAVSLHVEQVMSLISVTLATRNSLSVPVQTNE